MQSLSVLIKLVIFLIIAGVVFGLMTGLADIFGIFSIISFCGAGIAFLAWLFDKFFISGGNWKWQ